jgi:hypothetical protein
VGSERGIANYAYGLFLLYSKFFQICGICTTINVNAIGDIRVVRRASLWCGVAQLVARRLAVRQARVRFSARHHREVPPLSKQAMKKWREASANGDG